MSYPELFDLGGKTALITGASGGIGRAIAETLASAGATVFLGGRNAERLKSLQNGITAVGGGAEICTFDVSDAIACQSCVNDIAEKTGALDILVNCAGSIERGALSEVSDAAWSNVIETNLTSAFVLSRAAAPLMTAKHWGRIVNVGSILSVQGKANACSYVASKHGLAGLTRALAAELGREGVCVNALCPGYVRTDINTTLQEDPHYSAKIEAATPSGRWGAPSDMAGPALFLSSEACAYVNGQLLVVDGGMTATH